jgi:hypothetical protein
MSEQVPATAAYDVALGVLFGFTMDEEVGRQALAAVQSHVQALQARLTEATELLAMERSWAGCFCHVGARTENAEHEPDCTWAEWLERYEAFKAEAVPIPPHPGDPGAA